MWYCAFGSKPTPGKGCINKGKKVNNLTTYIGISCEQISRSRWNFVYAISKAQEQPTAIRCARKTIWPHI